MLQWHFHFVISNTSSMTITPSLDRLLAPRSVAVIGASDDAARIGGRPIASMLRLGYAGRILPVNPNRQTVQGLTAYPSVDALPEVPDVAIVAVPAPQVLETVTALAQRGVPGASCSAPALPKWAAKAWRCRPNWSPPRAGRHAPARA